MWTLIQVNSCSNCGNTMLLCLFGDDTKGAATGSSPRIESDTLNRSFSCGCRVNIRGGLLGTSILDNCKESVLLVANKGDALIDNHPGFCEHHVGLCGYCDMNRGARRQICFGAASTNVRTDTIFLARHDGSGRVGERTNVGHLDLNYMSRLRFGEKPNVLKRIALLVHYHSGFCATPVEKRDDLGILVQLGFR